MKIMNYISRIIVGILFIFSGTVKAIDPSGTMYKLQDYFQAFNIGFLDDLSLLFTILLCSAEFLSGFSVLFNIRPQFGIRMVMTLMIIFTPLTLVLALTNPVSDCGCFGDAIRLTNWQTFGKNVILMLPVLWLFLRRKSIIPWQGTARGWALLSIAAAGFLLFIFFNIRYLPVIDFLPYKTGTYIPGKMVIPEGAAPDKYETTFIYEKNGVKKEFDLSNYPGDDSSWKFIDQKSVLVSRGYTPPIHDFILTSPDNEDLTGQILSDENYTLLMVSRQLGQADKEQVEIGLETGLFCLENSIGFYLLTSSPTEEVNRLNRGLPVCMVDETTLKTMVRANPGYLLIRKGTIIHKWSWANLPAKKEILEIITNNN